MTAMLALAVISPEQTKSIAIMIVAVTGFVSIASVLYPLARGWARRLEGRGSDDRPTRSEVEELRARVLDLETQVARVSELEDRIDFTERLMTRQQDPARLAPAHPEEGG
jgi:hypothetical protein